MPNIDCNLGNEINMTLTVTYYNRRAIFNCKKQAQLGFTTDKLLKIEKNVCMFKKIIIEML